MYGSRQEAMGIGPAIIQEEWGGFELFELDETVEDEGRSGISPGAQTQGQARRTRRRSRGYAFPRERRRVKDHKRCDAPI